MPAKADFDATFAALKKILQPYEKSLSLKTATPAYYYLETVSASFKAKPLFFGAVRMGKNYVSYHFMPLYGCPEMLKSISPELKRRMQGKACFNFTAPDKQLFNELAKLTEAGFRRYKA